MLANYLVLLILTRFVLRLQCCRNLSRNKHRQPSNMPTQ